MGKDAWAGFCNSALVFSALLFHNMIKGAAGMSQIIHVDNSDFFRKLVKSFLSELGYQSEGFSRGGEAITAVEGGNATCVITGLALSDMGGEEFIKRLTVSAKTVPIIVVTSENNEDLHQRLYTLGVKAVIQKSAGWKELLGEQLAIIT